MGMSGKKGSRLMCLSLTEIPLSGCIASFILSCSQASKHFPKEFPFFFFPFEEFSFEISTCNLPYHLNVASISGFCWQRRAIKISKEFPRMWMRVVTWRSRWKIVEGIFEFTIKASARDSHYGNHNKSSNRQLVARVSCIEHHGDESLKQL